MKIYFRISALSLLFSIISISHSFSQGLAFSYLLPKNGYLSAPISPFSIRGVGIGKTVGLETGFTLYSMPGLSMSDLPFESNKPLTGPNWAVLVPMELILAGDFGDIGLKVMGGGFGLWTLSSRINEGNMDRALAKYEGWDVTTSDFEMKTKIGWGWMAGGEIEYRVNKKFAITIEAQYLKGKSKSAIKGTYAGGNSGGVIVEKEAHFRESKTNLEGLELSIGVKLGGK